MALIRTIDKGNGFIINTYKNAKSGNVTHILKSTIFPRGKKILNCDKFENPQRMLIVLPNGKQEIYKKAADGSTIMECNNKITNLTNLVFNNICSNIFK